MNAAVMDSPIGPIRIVSNGECLMEVVLPESDHNEFPDVAEADDRVIRQTMKELKEYFAGRRKQFTVPLCVEGTEFQEAAWEALRAIPYGETRSYGEQAHAIGKPGAARAVGQANRRNKLPIIIPCHRVMGANGSIGGYMGKWGEQDSIKSWLLDLEQGRIA